MEEKGVAPCLWLKRWCKATEKSGSLAFPVNGTFNLGIWENLWMVLYDLKPPSRPAQFEALAIGELMARQQQKRKFGRRMRRAEKTLAQARCDCVQKVWRRETLDRVKLFPAIAQEGEGKGRKDTRKTDKSPSRDKEPRKSSIGTEDSDDDKFFNQLLNDRPPPYVADENGPSTCTCPIGSIQEKATMNPTQVIPVLTQIQMQSSFGVPTTQVMQPLLQPPQVQRLYPDVPILETTTNLMVPTEPIYSRPKLIQTEPTPPLLPQVQPQMFLRYTSVTGPQLDMTPVMSQNMGVSLPQVLGNRQTPDAISLPIMVGPPVPSYAQAKPSVCDQGVMTQNTTRGGFVGSSQGTTPVEPTFEGPRSLLDFSPIGAPPDAMRQAGSRLLTPQISNANVPQTPLVQSGNISLQGLIAQQLTDWLDKLNTPQTAPVAAGRAEGEEYLNQVRLGMEANELLEGSMGVNRLESYTEAELRYLCPKITREVSKVHQRLANLADKYGIDLENTKHLKRSYRLDFEPKDFEHMRSTGMEAHLKEILQSAQVWGALEKWEGRWVKKRDKRKSDCIGQSAKTLPDTSTVKMLPM
ncbi:hypothetical protein NDU88_002793 [Pleurodeles waltl]|uniref:Uncharacterized protein n=1 Tax=Pleurodeles waltl TaxID=8319 RepID=A0AAV7P7S0_PLEWA|nr:hypothetical protein NDU88_002793 [Pleurodeles waltl]